MVPSPKTTIALWIIKIRVQPGSLGTQGTISHRAERAPRIRTGIGNPCTTTSLLCIALWDQGMREYRGRVRFNRIILSSSTAQKGKSERIWRKKAYLISAELPEPQWLPWGKKRDGEIMSISSIIFVTFIFTVSWARLLRWSKLTAYDGLWQNCHVSHQQRIQPLQLTQLF